MVNVLKACADNVAVVRGIFFGYSPAKVNVDKPQLPLLAPFTELRKHPFDEVVPLGVHVVEDAANEDVDTLPPSGHPIVPPSLPPANPSA